MTLKDHVSDWAILTPQLLLFFDMMETEKDSCESCKINTTDGKFDAVPPLTANPKIQFLP